MEYVKANTGMEQNKPIKMMYNKARKSLEFEAKSGPFIQPIINKIAGLIRQQLRSHICKGNLLLGDTVNV